MDEPIEVKPKRKYTKKKDQTQVQNEQREMIMASSAKMYEKLIPVFDARLVHFSKKALSRIIQSLVKIPLMDVNYKMTEQEKEFYSIVDRLMQSKFLLESLVLQDEIELNKQNLKKEEENGKVP